MDYQDHCKTQFSQEELLSIASSLSLDLVTPETELHVLVDKIRVHILENGASEDPLVEEFINTLRLYDDTEQPTEQPQCFGYAYDYAQSCTYCLAYSKCGEKLVENLPNCYGVLFDPTNDDCTQCMVRFYCNVNLPKTEEIEGAYEVYLPLVIPFLGNMLTFLSRYRNVRYNWPEELLTHKHGRFRSFIIRGIKWSESFQHVLKDAIYFGGGYGEKPTERIPVQFDATRKPVLKEGSFPIRLTWKFGTTEDEPS